MRGTDKLAALDDQNNGLVKPATPTEEIAIEIAMKIAARKRRNMKRKAAVYIIEYLGSCVDFSRGEVETLTLNDLNNLPELIFMKKRKRVIMFGWFPILGWVFTVRYLLFKSRVKFLRSLSENIFDETVRKYAIEECFNPALPNYN